MNIPDGYVFVCCCSRKVTLNVHFKKRLLTGTQLARFFSIWPAYSEYKDHSYQVTNEKGKEVSDVDWKKVHISRISGRGCGAKWERGGSKVRRPIRGVTLPREARKLSEDTTIRILKNGQSNRIYNKWDCKLNPHAAIKTHWKHVFNHPFHCNVFFYCGPG